MGFSPGELNILLIPRDPERKGGNEDIGFSEGYWGGLVLHEEKDMDNQRVWIKYTNYTFFSRGWFIGVKVVKAACE